MGVGNIDNGPVVALIGSWRGDKGMDMSPEPDGTEENPYYETIVFEAAGDVTNAEPQTLAIVRYHQVVGRKSNDEVLAGDRSRAARAGGCFARRLRDVRQQAA